MDCANSKAYRNHRKKSVANLFFKYLVIFISASGSIPLKSLMFNQVSPWIINLSKSIVLLDGISNSFSGLHFKLKENE